ncbi:hypothetical protein NDA18_002509 [Ustilago nuda]|nr:hypothetical protein NDA18_002509 [Ustilago nuda]
MPKDRPLAPSSPFTVRGVKEGKSGNKRKDPFSSASTTSTTSNKSVSRLQLEDIFSTLPPTPKQKVKSDPEEKGKDRLKKKPKLTPDQTGAVKSKGKSVSALKLLTSTSTPTKSSSAAPPNRNLTNKPITHMEVATAIPRTDLVQSTKSSIELSAPASPNSAALASAGSSINPNVSFKTMRTTLRILIASLRNLTQELSLIDRIWYKNKSQFKAAFWWSCFNSSRRSLHKLCLASSCSSVGLARESLGKFSLVYAGIGGGIETFHTQQQKLKSIEPDRYANLPKFERKPTSTTLSQFISSTEGRKLIEETREMVQLLEQVLVQVKQRAATAGRVLVKHMNTPPAPTFAPLVTSLLALMGNVHSIAGELVGAEGGEEMGEEKDGSVGVMRRLLEDLL